MIRFDFITPRLQKINFDRDNDGKILNSDNCFCSFFVLIIFGNKMLGLRFITCMNNSSCSYSMTGCFDDSLNNS